MANNFHGPSEVSLSIETSVGAGAFQDFSAFVRSGIELGHEQERTEITGFGATARKRAVTGLQNHEDITLDLLLDDTGTYALFMGKIDTDPDSTGRRLSVVYGSAAQSYHISVLTVQPRLSASLDNLQMLPITLTPTDEGIHSSTTST